MTICTQGRNCLFGEISRGQMRWNEAGEMVKTWWAELRHKFPNVELDTFVVMPNHLHWIIRIVGADLCVRPAVGAHIGAPLHAVVQWFKTMTTNDYMRGTRNRKWPRFSRSLWQRNYYEHVIRTEETLWKIREYICANPQTWADDSENPARSGTVPDEIEAIIERDCEFDIEL